MPAFEPGFVCIGVYTCIIPPMFNVELTQIVSPTSPQSRRQNAAANGAACHHSESQSNAFCHERVVSRVYKDASHRFCSVYVHYLTYINVYIIREETAEKKQRAIFLSARPTLENRVDEQKNI